MRFASHYAALGLMSLILFCVLRCSDARSEDTANGGRAEAADVKLVDGVYPVISSTEAELKSDPELKFVELPNVPVRADGTSAETKLIQVIDQPLLRFRDVPHFNFKFENDECSEVGFQNTNDLMAYTREHVGSRLAVVINNKVISSHKIREPITTRRVRITCCTVGGGDHLHKHLKALKLASKSKEESR